MFTYKLRVYYQDTDAAGLVYHANYLDFAERARGEALRGLGVPVARMRDEHGTAFVVRRAELDYQRPARLDDELTVVTRFGQIGGASVKLRQEFLRDSDSLAVLELLLVCVRLADGRATRVPDAWRAAVAAAIEDEG